MCVCEERERVHVVSCIPGWKLGVEDVIHLCTAGEEGGLGGGGHSHGRHAVYNLPTGSMSLHSMSHYLFMNE